MAAENLDKDELSEELVTAFIREGIPEVDCVKFSVKQFYTAEAVGSEELNEFRTGDDNLPRNFVFGESQRGQWDFGGLEGLINAGVLSSQHVRDYSKKDSMGYTWKYHVYKIDFTEDARNSKSVRINVQKNLTPESGILFLYCPGQRQISDVKYVMPNGSNTTTATFNWNVVNDDPFSEKMRNHPDLWGVHFGLSYGAFLPQLAGTGSAVFQQTNQGWEMAGINID